MSALRTRRPTKTTWWPRVLVTGGPGTCAARTAAEVTADRRLAASYWLEVGQDANADSYAHTPGADYDVIVHDGTWLDMYEQLSAAWDEARAAAEAGYPSALIITSMSGVHAMLNDTADLIARRQHAAALTARGLDPAAAWTSQIHVEVHPDVWKLMGRRHQQLMAKILTWPGPVVMTARETRTPDGHWHLRANDQLGFDATAWVRLLHDDQPEIVLLDTVQHYRLTRSERAALRNEVTLTKLIWDWSGCGTDTQAPAPRTFTADQVLPGEQPTRVLQAVRTARPQPAVHTRAVTPKPAARTAEDVTVEDVTAEDLPSTAERAAHLTDAWLFLADRKKVQQLWERTHNDMADALDEDIAGLLSEQDREALSVPAGEAFPLRELAARAAAHVGRTGTTLTGRDQVGVA